MFIKKDLRKIGEMLDSSSDATPLTHLKLGRRPAEFKPVGQSKSSRGVKGGPSSGATTAGGNLNVLVGTKSNLEKCKWLKYLSVYDSEIESIEGIGRLECGEIEEINGAWSVCGGHSCRFACAMSSFVKQSSFIVLLTI